MSSARSVRGGRPGAEPPPLYLHVGLAKTGTTYLQSLLAENREVLREQGFIYPFVRPEGMFHAAVELSGEHADWGLEADLVEGTWARLVERARSFDGTAVISHELLARLRPDAIAAALAPLSDRDVHVVVTARDPGRQVTAHWQEQVKNGSTCSFADVSEEVIRYAGAGPGDDGFSREQDLVGVLRRWGDAVGPGRTHVVVNPAPGAAPDELWRRFAGVVGLDPEPVLRAAAASPAGPAANTSLGVAEVALLREVNRRLEGELPRAAYLHVVKRFLAQRVLADGGSPRPLPPLALRDTLERVADLWIAELRERGYDVAGDLEELRPHAYADPGVTPDDAPPLPAGEMARIVTELVVRIVRDREGRDAAAEPQPPGNATPRRRPRWLR